MSEATPASPLTVVLVHGAFADAGSWADVVKQLQGDGIEVLAIANPLRDVASDSAYVGSLVSQISGPVLLVGHSYAGIVISNAATQAKNVTGLVYVSAVIPEEGEANEDVGKMWPDSAPKFGPSLQPMNFPLPGGGTAQELTVALDQFPGIFAADLDPATGKALGASQRPLAAAATQGKSGAPAWKTLPSWAILGTADQALGAEALRAMAKRANSNTVEVEGASHLIMISHPDAVTKVILTAIRSLGE